MSRAPVGYRSGDSRTPLPGTPLISGVGINDDLSLLAVKKIASDSRRSFHGMTNSDFGTIALMTNASARNEKRFGPQ
jgi:hypothetical protein